MTRLGKFINLIRRKLADVDKKLSKRLKKLVKHWLQLVPPKLPNGATSTLNSRSLTTPTSGGSTGGEEKSLSEEREFPAPLSNGYTYSFTRVESPRSVSSRPYSPLSSQDSSSQNTKPSTSSSLESDCSLDLNSRSTTTTTMRNHIGDARHSISPTPPPASPTPPYSTSSRPSGQPSSVSSSKNRHKLMHKLSGFKKKPSPTFTPALISNISSNNQQHSVPHISTAVPNSTPDLFQSTVQLSSPPFSPAIDIASDSFSGASSPTEAWTYEGTGFFHGGDFPTFDSITEKTLKSGGGAATVQNGVNKDILEILNNSRKRQRSDSPLSKDSSSSLKHKRRKKRKHGSSSGSSKTKRVEQLTVSIPRSLVTVNLQHRDHHSSAKSITKKSRSPENNRTKHLGKLMVRVDLALLRGASSAETQPKASPQSACGKQDNKSHIHTNGTVNSSNSSLSRALSSKDRKLKASSNSQRGTDAGMWKSNYRNTPQKILVPPVSSEDVPDGNMQEPDLCDAEKKCTIIKDVPVPVQQEVVPKNLPEGALPGINGCVGGDGQWYEWTECIPGRGSEITVLPYIYIDM